MSRKSIGEKRHSFSMRKLSVGLVSVTVSSFFLMSQGIQSVSADNMESPIHYKYMTEGKLTDEEKSLLVEALPQLAEESDDTYYLVYRSQQFLPNTGFNPTVGTFLFTAGLSLLVLLVSKRENGKKRLVHFLLLTSMGVQLLPASAFGLTSQILSAYNSQLSIGVGEHLPEPLKIEGYQYIGYIKTKKQDNTELSRTVDGKYSAQRDSQPNSTKTSDVVHSADLEWNQGQGKVSLQGEASGDDGLSEKSSIAADNLSSNDSFASQVEQNPDHKGESVVRPTVPEQGNPVSATTVQSAEEEVLATTNDRPEYKLPLETKGTQEPGHEGEAAVREDLPVYTKPLETKGTQGPGHEGEAAVREEEPAYTEPLATKGTQEPGHEGKATVREETLEYTEPVATKGTQEPEHEGEAAVEEELPALEVTTRNRTEIQNIPYTTEEIQDPTLLKNRRKIERQGQAGTRTIQYEDYIVNGNVVETKEVSRTEVAPVNEVVKVGTLVKVKPTVEITNLTKVENKKSITVSYNLIDTTSAYVSAKTQVFHGDKLVKEVDIENPAKEQVISGLDYYTPYTVKTHLTYNLGENNEENTETSTQDFQLEYKKIEIKDIDSVELYGKENDRYRRYLSLSEAPTDTAKYFVKVKSDRFKEMYLPVKSITENTDGTYKVTVAVDQLVEEGTDGYKDDYTFTVAKSKAEQPGVYTSFKQLVTAMQSNLSGVYTLASDMTADEVSLGDKQTSYLTGAFTGSLIGSDGTKSYAIYDLKKPLFDTLNGATVRDLDIKTVSADSKENVAALAKAANSANINNVAVEGKISGAKSVAGLVASATNTVIENSSFTGKLIANHQDSNKNDTGGIVGSTWQNGRVNNVVSNVDVGDGYVITGDQYAAADVKNASTSVDNRKADRFATKLSKDQIDAKVADYGITVTLDDTGQDLKRNLREVDYTRLNKAEAERKVAYSNIEKLMPFYNKDLVVHYGNKVATTDKLYTTELLDVVPMKDDEVVTDINNKKNSINKVMLHFKDNTVEYLDVTFKENFINSQVIEYNVTGKEYIFTPEAFVSDYTAITNNVLSDLQNVTLNSEATKKVLGAANDAALDNLYLDRQFEEVKANIAEHLRKVLAMDKSINTTGDGVVEYVSEKIKNNKEAFMLGLTYMNRWYDINYGKMNTKDLSTYKFDFNGNNETSTLDTIVALGNSGLDNLRASNTVGLYANKLASVKGEDSVFDFVEAYRKLFLPNKTNNEWFKENTKAYIVEMKSDIAEVREKQESPTADRKYSLGVYDRISAPSWGHKSMLLPLLTLPEESVYISSNMSTLAFGSYERYRDSVDGVILSGDALRTYVRNRVDIAAKRHRDHYDIWYNLLDSASKEKLFRSVIVYDGFNVKDETGRTYWARLTDKNIGSIKEFFGPVGKWYEYNSSAGAYANGSLTHFVLDRLLDAYGTSVYTHEMVHNSDSAIYFEGNGRREGLGAELYALGLLQSVDSVNSHILALNTLYKAEKDDLNRLHTYNPVERFDSDEALQSYMHGSYDVMYTLDAMEAKAILAQNNDVKKKWFRKIENYYVRDTRHNKDTHAGNTVRPLTDEEVANLTSLNSLIDNDIINRRSYDDNREYKRNGYYTISMFSPVYAALSNSKGAPGDIMFRKIAYELLAEKGYHKGFLPYVSNQYGAEAFASGSKTFSSWHGRDVALVTDDLVFKKVFNGEYSSWADFKKAMFKQRIDKQDNLKPITIQYELGNPNSTKEVTITTAAQMQQLINEAAAKDITNIDRATSHTPASWVHLLKQKIYNAYLRTTDDFRNSIYK
ncbi:TPA: G5 domain-containing protein [Streptococcus pneumoniae]|nr:G5 domain-containing protein [Streptococcus pneumoniae]